MKQQDYEMALSVINELESKHNTPHIAIGLCYAKTAVQTRTARKPQYEGDGYDDSGNLIYDTWICPNCDSRFEVDYDDYKHCPECGQAIDWSNEDDRA